MAEEKTNARLCGKCFSFSVMKGVCSKCGCTAFLKQGDALPVGFGLNGKYIIGDVLGDPGGFGIAYLAFDRILERKVVIKELFPSGLVTRGSNGVGVQVMRPPLERAFSQQKEIFLNEARKLARLDNVDSVVHVTDFFSENDTAYFAMSLVSGEPLASCIKTSGSVNAQRLLPWIWKLAEGLAAVHRLGILHRDIKPENIIIDQNNRPVLIDFGNAKFMGGGAEGVIGFFAVSPNFGAPEQYANNQAEMGPWTDIYGLGAIMYYCLSGRRPTDAKNRASGAQLVPLPDGSSPPLLREIIEQCLAMDPKVRPASMDVLLERLEPLHPGIGHWTQALPQNAFGRSMSAVHAHVQKGKALPVSFNWTAGVGQWFWLFGHKLPVPAAAVSLGVLGVFLVFLMMGAAWNLLPVAFFVAWAFFFLPCALYADFFLYRRISEIGASSSLASEAKKKQLAIRLQEEGRLRPFPLLLGLITPLLIFLTTWLLAWQQEGVKNSIERAIDIAELRNGYAAWITKNGVPPTLEELGFDASPNRQISQLELKTGAIEVVLALPEVKGRRVLWTLVNDSWHCKSIDLERQYVPDNCKMDDIAPN